MIQSNCVFSWKVVKPDSKPINYPSGQNKKVVVVLKKKVHPFSEEQDIKHRLYNEVLKEQEFQDFTLSDVSSNSVDTKGYQNTVVLYISDIKNTNHSGIDAINLLLFLFSLGVVPWYSSFYPVYEIVCYDNNGNKEIIDSGYDSSVESHTISGWIFIWSSFDQKDEIISPTVRNMMRKVFKTKHMSMYHNHDNRGSSNYYRQENSNETLYVNDKKGLHLRKQPSIESQIISLIPNGKPVTVLNKTNNKEFLQGKSGTWVFVSVDGESGYMFDGFLSKERP